MTSKFNVNCVKRQDMSEQNIIKSLKHFVCYVSYPGRLFNVALEA